MLSPGHKLHLFTGNPLYRTSLESRVIVINDHDLEIEMPSYRGRLAFLPVGTILKVSPAGAPPDHFFKSDVLHRSLRPKRALTITLPHSISRSGRPNPAAEASRVIAVTSGKGGVGKTTMSINLSIALCRLSRRVCVIDVDLGTANVDFLLNVTAPYNISHLLSGEKTLEEITVKGPEELLIIPGGSGLENIANLSERHFTRLISSFNMLDRECDIILLDTGAGIATNVTNFLVAADEVIVVTNPDPHAVLDAYALIKTLCNLKEKPVIKLIVNRIRNEAEESRAKQNLMNACRSFLSQPLEYLGGMPESGHVSRSVRERKPFILDSETDASACLKKIAGKLIGFKQPQGSPDNRGLRGFVNGLHKLFGSQGAGK